MILIDNYDSFTYNVVQYLEELGIEPKIFENDKVTIDELKSLDFDSIIISPGAGNPDTAGISMAVLEEFYKTKKILGICLGLVIGVFLHRYVMINITSIGLCFGESIAPLSYLYTIILALGFMIITTTCFYPKIKKIQMAEALKSVE